MKKLLYSITLLAAMLGATSCLSDNVEDKYKDWRDANNKWFEQQAQVRDADGSFFYTEVKAPWDPNAKVYMHWFNDRSLTQANLSPLYTSTVDVKYIGRIYDGTAFDSSFVSTSPRDSVARFAMNSVVEGWSLALMQMHVGDSVRVVINYPQAYGSYSMGDVIKPYSALQFDIKLDDIYSYEAK